MDLTLKAFLTSWSLRPDVILVVALLGSAYTAGWRRLKKRGPHVARKWQLMVYIVGLATVGLALLSPIDSFTSSLFLMHMIQHELLMMVAAPLLLLANPLPAFLWALPRRPRHGIGRLLTRRALVRRGLWALTLMPVAWLLYVVNLWVWHHPAMYEAALRNDLIHDLEHLAFFGTALLFWWPIINPAPRLHGHIHHGLRIVYVVAAAFQNTALGFLIATTERVLYLSYMAAPRLWGLSPLADQGWGGAIMSEGGMMYVIAVLVLVAKLLEREEQVTRQREAMELSHGGRARAT